MYIKDTLETTWETVPCHRPRAQLRRSALCRRRLPCSQDWGPQTRSSHKEIKYSSSGEKWEEKDSDRNSQSQPSLSLILAITNTPQTDDQRVNKRWVKSRRQTWSGFQGWELKLRWKETTLMNLPTGVEGEGEVQHPKPWTDKYFCCKWPEDKYFLLSQTRGKVEATK